MLHPLLLVECTHVLLAGPLVGSFLLGAVELGGDVEEVEGEEDHAGQHPLEPEVEEEQQLVPGQGGGVADAVD